MLSLVNLSKTKTRKVNDLQVGRLFLFDLDDPTRSFELIAHLDLQLYKFTRLLKLVLVGN